MKVPVLAGKEFEQLVGNGDRGFRCEAYFTLGSGFAAPWGKEDGMQELERQLAFYESEECRIVQLYFYLSGYLRRPLDAVAFRQMEACLARLEELGIRVVLRFAYEYDVSLLKKKGPTTGRIRQHCAQIGAWMRENETLLGSTVLVLQAGLYGAWGEWHNAQFPHSARKVLSFLSDMAPSWMPLQVRTLPIKRKAKGLPSYDRIGYHDDYLVGENFKWSTARAGEGSPVYQEFLEESRRTLNDGEMPWGRDTVFHEGYIDGKGMLRSCREHSLTTLSLAHNYREDAQAFNMERWKKEEITPQELDALGCAYTPAYFLSPDGKRVKKSVFEYLRDHLGYLLLLEEAQLREGTDSVQLSFTIRNVGFAPPHGFTELTVTARADGRECREVVEGYQPLGLGCGQSVGYTVVLPRGCFRRFGLQLRNPRAPRLKALFANRLPLEDGRQVLDFTNGDEALLCGKGECAMNLREEYTCPLELTHDIL